MRTVKAKARRKLNGTRGWKRRWEEVWQSRLNWRPLRRREGHKEGVQAYLVLLPFTLSHFYKLKVCGNPAWSKSYQRRFSNSICSLCASVSHFGNFHNTLNFFIICYGDQ